MWVDELVKPLKQSVALHIDDFIFHLRGFLSNKYDQLGSVRIIVDPYKSVPIDTVYVESTFSQANEILSEKDLSDRIENGESFTIEGFGGAGKSIFMRHLWRFLALRGHTIPLLVELRNLDCNKETLIEFILNNCVGEGPITMAQFEMLLSDGRFTILLDGFDEIGRDEKRDVERQILKSSDTFNKCSFIVTGRPDDRFASWENFYSIKVRPLTFDQFSDLINRVDFDAAAKVAFQKRADESFFNLHREFLSNPLLALMMLISFGENAEIPSRLSVFYKQCFDALFRKHDAMKQSYERQRTLDRIDFERFFSVFSFLSHQDKKVSFGDNYFHNTISASIDYLGLPKDQKEGIEVDVLESLNLLAKEGDLFFYIHRSFQEYFAACCVTNVMVDEAAEALAFFAEDTNSTAFRLCCEMHEDLVKEKYLIPEYERLRDCFPANTGKDGIPLAVDFLSCVGEMGCHLWRMKDGSKKVELNGWSFILSDELDNLYRSAANLNSEGINLRNDLNRLLVKLLRPLSNAPEMAEGDKVESLGNGRVIIKVQNGELVFSVDGVADTECIDFINNVINRARSACTENLLELDALLREFNCYLEKTLQRRGKERKLLLRATRE